MLGNRKRDLIILLLGGAALALLPLKVGDFYLYLIRLIGIYAISALGLNIFMGYCGQINLSSAGFRCIGAYIPTILQVKLGWHYLAALPVSVVFCLGIAWAVSWPLLRLRGHAMAIGTLSFAMAIYLVAERFPALTGGSDGIVVPSMVLFGQTIEEIFFYYFILIFLIASYLACYLLMDSRIGRAMKAVRGDEAAAAAMGVDVYHYKKLAWLVNGVLSGLAGTLYAQQAGFLSPVIFSLWTNIIVLVMICVGGLGMNLGSVVGAAIMTSLPYFLVTIQEYTVLVQGLILFAVLRFLPDGVVGTIAKSYGRFTLGKRKEMAIGAER
jgi:branched-chain amino acid transport system permease protein